MAGYQQQFAAANAALIVVGNGKPTDLPEFSELTGYSGKLFTDPTLNSFKALEFTRKVSGLFATSALVGGLKALKDGYRPGTMQGDALQLGGAVVVGPGAQLYYYFRGQQAADHPPIEEMLNSCRDDYPPLPS